MVERVEEACVEADNGMHDGAPVANVNGAKEMGKLVDQSHPRNTPIGLAAQDRVASERSGQAKWVRRQHRRQEEAAGYEADHDPPGVWSVVPQRRERLHETRPLWSAPPALDGIVELKIRLAPKDLVRLAQ